MQELLSNVISTGVYIITVRSGERINGMTAAWVTQVSFKPKLVVVSIAPARYTHNLIQESGFFCINTLSKDDIELAKKFGFLSGRNEDKFKDINYTNALKGSPIIEGAIAYVECEVVSSVDAGDHTLFIGQVVDAAILKEDKEPLIFKWKDFFK